MAPFALIGIAGGLALFWAAAFSLARALWTASPARIVAFAAIWTLAEFARAYVLTGFPWALVGYAWVETPVMQMVALMGPHLLGFLTLAAAMLPGLGSLRAAVLAGLLVGAGWGWGAWRLAQPLPERAPPVLVRIVQPNAVQREKWDPERHAEFRRRLLEGTRAAGAPDVTIWPETAVPFVLGQAPGEQAEAAAAAGPGGRLILGIVRGDGEGWYNSLAVLEPGGMEQAVYDKHHLVPFGEYVPLTRLFGGLGRQGLATGSGFTSGPGPRLVTVPGLPPFLPLICYEAIFPQGLRVPEGRAEWLVQVTNDAWFGTASGPYQHLAQARVRAIEQGLPLARAANTGVSAMIDPYGRVIASLGLGEAGYVDAALPGVLSITGYARLGDTPALIVSIVLLGLTFTLFFDGSFLKGDR
jgi:apolipoprotein N-acyltransferase